MSVVSDASHQYLIIDLGRADAKIANLVSQSFNRIHAPHEAGFRVVAFVFRKTDVRNGCRQLIKQSVGIVNGILQTESGTAKN